MKWYEHSVIYQIYPRSFYDSNNDGIGDLRGIADKLDYLVDLGVGGIWLSPVYCSPMVDFGYDISDHCDIDPIFGDLKDFDYLLDEVHKRGMRLLMDYIPNHTSDQHPWFIESRSSKNNPKRDWYLWQDAKDPQTPPNNWLSVFGGSGWQYDNITDSFYYHSFVKEQPDLNWHNPEVVAAMSDILRFWLERGVDGFRMDAVYFMFKDKQLRDNPPNPAFQISLSDPYHRQLNIYNYGLPETFEVLKKFCSVLSGYPDKYMITEVYGPIPDLMKFYQVCNPKIHSPFNFNFLTMSWSAVEYKKFVDEFENALTPQDLPTYVLGNHDRPRVASRVGLGRARLLALMLLTLRGMPFIYYGEELGMMDVPIPSDKIQDPFEKQVPGLGLGRDPARTPMQWNAEPYAGFSKMEPWLPLSPDFQQINILEESADPSSMLNLYKKLLQLRRQMQVLSTGTYDSIDCRNLNVFAYGRTLEQSRCIVLLNFSEKEESIYLPYSGEIVCSTHPGHLGFVDLKESLTLKPYEGILISWQT